MLRLLSLILFLHLLSSVARAQHNCQRLMEVREIKLPEKYRNGYEFSGLCQLPDNRFLIIPQRENTILVTSGARIKKALEANTDLELEEYTYDLPLLTNVLDQRCGHKDVFDGLEAVTATENNMLCFSIETTDEADSCYLVRANIADAKINMDIKTLQAIPKVRNRDGSVVSNAGYEALAFLKNSKKLFAFFEFNHIPSVAPYALGIKASAVNKVQIDSVHYRITDAFFEGDTLFCLNYNYRGEKVIAAPEVVHDFDRYSQPKLYDICRIIMTSYNAKTGSFSKWTLNGYIPNINNCNWEGLCRYDKGFLMMSDSNRNLQTKLVFVW